MSRVVIETSSGKRFGTHKQVGEEKLAKRRAARQTSEAQKEFTKICSMYGLPPEFYGIGCLTSNGEFGYLVGLAGEFAQVAPVYDMEHPILYTFVEAMDMVIAEAQKELDEVGDMMDILYGDRTECSVKTEVRRELRWCIECAANAITICNFEIPKVLESMNLSRTVFRAGWVSGEKTNHVYELVSYRGENENPEPFILEDICKQSIDPSRFKMVSYESLKSGLVKYATQMNDIKMLHLIEHMCEPVVEIIEVNTGEEHKTEKKQLKKAAKKCRNRKKKVDAVDKFQQTFKFC